MFDNETNKYVRLESNVYVKYLGVLIDQNLSWKYHIGPIVKSYATLYLDQYYWGQACKTCLNKILILQKRALRLLYFTDWHDHAIPLFLEANVLSITFLCYESVSTLMYDINNGKAPTNMLNLFQKTSNIHSYNTRLSPFGKSFVKSSRLEIQNSSFSRLGIRLWNKIHAI